MDLVTIMIYKTVLNNNNNNSFVILSPSESLIHYILSYLNKVISSCRTINTVIVNKQNNKTRNPKRLII